MSIVENPMHCLSSDERIFGLIPDRFLRDFIVLLNILWCESRLIPTGAALDTRQGLFGGLLADCLFHGWLLIQLGFSTFIRHGTLALTACIRD